MMMAWLPRALVLLGLDVQGDNNQAALDPEPSSATRPNGIGPVTLFETHRVNWRADSAVEKL